MNDDERAEFESRLNLNKELQQEVHIQQEIINAAINAGVKVEFAKAIRKRIMMRKAMAYGIVVISFIILI